MKQNKKASQRGENKDLMYAEPAVKPQFLIVGIGASAGGIEALKEFFLQVPADSDMAYVVILHLSPEFESHLSEVLQHTAKIPVTQVTEKVHVVPNHVYVISPSNHLQMLDGHITVSPNISFEERRAPVDIFFRTLAESHDSRAVGVVLSGTGANGSMGIKRVKERGGAAFVQDPKEAQFNEMPHNSIATELIDAVLPVAEIPGKIIAYKNSLGTINIAHEPEERPDEEQRALREIFVNLRLKTGHDFSNYKSPTVLRRIERRMYVRSIASLPEYANYMKEQPDETQALLKDLLISVTNFFRDAKAFEAVEKEILPAILKDKNSGEQIRIWVAGCATGEEAYSLAILMAEKLMDVTDAPQVQIFATDIDEAALSIAREGLYTLNDAADITPERLKRYFTKQGNNYCIRKEIREMILFASHNVLKDPPFSRLHLATCRNMLIYLNKQAQQRIMETFHFALLPGAYLFLGTSESVDGAGDLYATLSRENHIYQSRQTPNRTIPVTDSMLSLSTYLKNKTATPELEDRLPERMSFGDLHQQLLELYAPPSVIVNENYDVLHLSETAGRFMQLPGGEPSSNILKLVTTGLRIELRSILYSAVQQKASVKTKPLQVQINGKKETISIHVQPVLRKAETARGFLLIMFEPVKATQNGERTVRTTDESVTLHLENELITTKEQLRSAAEEHELQSEEFKAANEELQALNEELRSAAEELETGKEELQSINEELRTVNQELKIKIEEVTVTSNNLQNLINSTSIGTIFLDRGFKVVLFTPMAREIFNLIPIDIGRPLSDITNKLTSNGLLLSDAEKVLGNLQPVERQLLTSDNKYYTVRLLPYRTADDHINGVVITFYDITERIKQQEALRISEEKFRTLFNSIDEAVAWCEMITDDNGKAVDYRLLELNPSFEKVTGLTVEASKGKTAKELIPGIEESWIETYAKVALQGEAMRFENKVEQLDRWFDAYASPVGDRINRQFVIVYTDITERKYQEAKQKFLIKLSDILRSTTDSVEIQSAVTYTVMNEYSADRCYYVEINEDVATIRRDAARDGLPSVAAVYPLNEMPMFKALMKNSHPIIIENVNTSILMDENLKQLCLQSGILAYINVPVIKNNDVAGNLCITQSEPRKWKDIEIDLAKETAGRTWAAVEKAKAEEAVKESEERFRSLAIATSDSVYKMSADWKQMDNLEGKNFLADTKNTNRSWLQNYIPEHEQQKVTDATDKSIQNKTTFELEHQVFDVKGNIAWTYSRAVPKLDEHGNIIEWIGTASNITESKKAEATLRQSEQRLQRMVNVPFLGVVTFNYNGKVLHANDAFIKMVGYNREEFEAGNFTWLRFTPLEHVEASEEVMRQLKETGVGGPYEKEYFRKDGSKIWLMFVAADLDDNMIVEYAIDISESKRTAEALHGSEERLQKALEIETVTVVFFNDEGKIIKANKAFFEKTGYTPEEVSGVELNLRDMTPPEWIPVMEKALSEIMTAGVATPYEKELLRRDGSRWWGLCAKARILENYNVEYVIDVTKRREAEDALHHSEDRYRIALLSANMAAWDWNITEDTVQWNDQHFYLLGLQPDNKQRRSADFIKSIYEDDLEKVTQALQKAINETGLYQAEFRIVRADDKQVCWMSGYGRAVTTENGKATRMVGVMFDITERKKLEQQKEDFIGIASHELKTPVTSIKAYAEVLHDIFDEGEDVQSKELMQKLDAQVDRLIDLIRALLDTSKLAEGEMVLKPERFDVCALIEERVHDLQQLSNIHHINLTKFDNEFVYADRERIGQVLNNFISNAIKYSPKGGNVTIACKRVNDKVQISVADEGIGISEEAQRKVFDRFFRVKSEEMKNFAGLGLGLYITAYIVQKHGGEIWVESKPGKGATFYFTVPVNDEIRLNN